MSNLNTPSVTPRASELFLPKDAPLYRAVEVIEKHKGKIVLVVGGEGRLAGTITDGDIRRGLLRGCTLDSPISVVMNPRPHVVSQREGGADMFDIMRQHNLRQIPVVDDAGRVVDIGLLTDFILPAPLHNMVVIMAGGEGKRLRPLTENVPKPMLRVGGRPILETVINRFAQEGLSRIVLSVNYRADVIRGHFGSGRAHNVDIRYIQETEPLGTAGSLRLLPDRPTLPLLVVNGDVLTKVSYRDMLQFHGETGARITLCVQHYPISIPFGAVTVEGERVVELREKPVFDCFINSGIYILEPDVLDLIPREGVCDMPDLINAVLADGGRVSAFPIREYWVDVGRVEDLHRAHNEFESIFG